MTSMLHVQLKIIWTYEWKQNIINDNCWGKTDLIELLILPLVYYYNLITF